MDTVEMGRRRWRQGDVSELSKSKDSECDSVQVVPLHEGSQTMGPGPCKLPTSGQEVNVNVTFFINFTLFHLLIYERDLVGHFRMIKSCSKLTYSV